MCLHLEVPVYAYMYLFAYFFLKVINFIESKYSRNLQQAIVIGYPLKSWWEEDVAATIVITLNKSTYQTS